MGLEQRKGIWYWRKTINGFPFARSTKTDDKKLAGQISALWEAEAIKEVVLKGTKPVLLHSVIKAFLDARNGTGGLADRIGISYKHAIFLYNSPSYQNSSSSSMNLSALLPAMSSVRAGRMMLRCLDVFANAFSHLNPPSCKRTGDAIALSGGAESGTAQSHSEN